MKIVFTAAKVKFPKGFPQIPGFIVSTPRIKRTESDVAKLCTHKGASFGFAKKLLEKAVSEAVERFSSSIYKKESLICATAGEIENPVNIQDFILYSEKQYKKKLFPFIKYSNFEQIYWFPVYNLVKKKSAHIPANFVYPPPKGNWVQFDAWTSNGLAAHTNTEAAVLNGICEVLERDALMCWRLTKRNALPVAANFFGKSKRIQKLLSLLQKHGLSTSLVLIRNDMEIITVVAFIELRGSKRKITVFGSSCKNDLLAAVESSILEAIMVARTQSILQRRKSNSSQTKSFFNHVMISPFKKRSTASIAEIKNLIKNHPRTGKRMIEVIKKSGYSIYYADITPKIARDSGYIVVKVFIPGLYPMEMTPKFLHFGPERLYRFCKKN